MMKPINCIVVKRSIIDHNTGNCTGTVLGSDDSKVEVNKTIYYKLLDKKFYTIISNTDHYDFIRIDCVFGVDE